MKQLSIIIPHYNSCVSLQKLLNSIPSSEDIQVIVVDDRSNNDLEKLDELKNTFLNVLFLCNDRVNKGAGTARNTGLDYAIGKWILFADADDYFLPDFFDIIRPYFYSSCDIVFFKPTSIDISTGKLSERHIPYSNLIDNYSNNLNKDNIQRLRYFFYVPWSKLIKRSLVTDNKIKFSESMVSNDVMFSTKIGYYAKEIEISEKCFYCVTKSSDTLTGIVSSSRILIRVDIFIEQYHFLKNKLAKKDFKLLKMNANNYLIDVLYFKLGLKTFFTIIAKCYTNKIPFFYLKNLNLLTLPRKFYLQVYKKR